MNDSSLPTKKRLALLIAVTTIGTLVVSLFFYIAALDHIFTESESLAAISGVYPWPEAEPAIPEAQTEPHTCGLHATRSLYRSHRLDPDSYNLRFRLGTDRLAVSGMESSQGTVQADLYRVLAQDGFHVVGLDLAATHRQTVLLEHLRSGLKALALIRRPENGNLHWILLQLGESEDVLLVDSLESEQKRDLAGELLATKAVSVALIYPGSEADLPSIKEAYRLGVEEMQKTPGRVSELEESIVQKAIGQKATGSLG